MSEFGARRKPARFQHRGRRGVAIVRVRRRPRTIQVATTTILRQLGIETKYYDTSLVGSALTTNTDGSGGEHDQSATIGPSTILLGDLETNRDGRKASFISWQVSGIISCAANPDETAMKAAISVFIAFVWDKQTNGALLNSEDVYINDTGSAFGGTSLLRNMKFTKRFQVLGVRRFTMQMPNVGFDGTDIEQGGAIRNFSFFKKFSKPILALYSAGTETIVNSVDNSLHILAWTSDTGLAPTITYNSRLRFRG